MIGIDLGTTNSVVSFLEAGRPVVIPNEEGSNTTPSVVFFRGGDEIIVGELAKRQMVSNPSHTISSAKRFMGRRINEISDTVKQVHYQLADDPENDRILIDLEWKKISPEEVSAEILKKMRKSAEIFLDEIINQAVVTVPAYFNDSQRSATKKAAEMAGLEVMRIVNEPTAAALAYGLNREGNETIAVFDFGGGTFDVSILELSDNMFEVRSTNGDTFLGGENIDHIIFNLIKDEIKEQTGIEINQFPQAVQRACEAAEKAKCELSSMNVTTISLPFLVSDDSGPKHYNREITRQEFEGLITPVIERLLPPCRMALMDAGLSPSHLDAVIMVGGSTRIPKVIETAADFFGKDPVTGINPDEVVAMGAAVQAGVITGQIEEVLLLDITPLSLGIELADDLFSVIIPRNSSVPTTAFKKFTTVKDNQKNVYIHVLQGERKRASQNRSLSHFRLTDITPAPKEVPEIEVKFTVDANGILNVSATDMTSGESREVRIESYHAAIPSDYEEDLKKAEESEEEDRAYIERVRRHDRARKVEEVMRKFLHEQRKNIPENELAELMEIVDSLSEATDKNNFEAMEQWERTLLSLAENHRKIFKKYKSVL